MARYSGIYLHFEGTTAECDAMQIARESVFDTDSGLFRYMDSASGIHYLGSESLWFDVGGGSGIFYPVTSTAKVYFGNPTGSYFSIEQVSSSTILSGSDGNIYIKQNGDGSATGNIILSGVGDVRTDAWQSYSPTLCGFSSVSSATYKYKSIGKTVFVAVEVSGIGDDNRTSFSLPYPADGDINFNYMGILAGWISGSTWMTYSDPSIRVPASGVNAEVKISINSYSVGSGGDFFGSGAIKYFCGTFWYQKA